MSEQLARAACARSQLSWIDAFCGDLGRATRYATSVLHRPAGGRQRERASGSPTLRPLGHTWSAVRSSRRGNVLIMPSTRVRSNHDPLLRAAQALTQARLAVITDEPETGLRLLSLD